MDELEHMRTRESGQPVDVVVIGGGLAGLAAAAMIGRAGRQVELIERTSALGGRARTRERAGFHLNLGPHALYVGGAGAAVLQQLAVPHAGAEPPTGGVVTRGVSQDPLPATPLALLRAPGLSMRSRLEAVRFFATIARGPLPPTRLSFDDWLDQRSTRPDLAALLRAFVRLSTYAAETDCLSAEAAALQLRQAMAGVRYVHGGWDTLVQGLARRAREAGVRMRTNRGVRSLHADAHRTRVVLSDGESITARHVILAVPPAAALELLQQDAPDALRRFAGRARPVLASCLDIGLRRLPRPAPTFALDLDRPRYLSCHSVAAGLAPAGQVLLQLVHYGAAPGDARADLEDWLQRMQPGWRDQVVMERWLPAARVCEALPEALHGGLAGRPAVDAAGAGILLCGDWVGPVGLLSDASLASARSAAERVIAATLQEAG